MCTRMMCGWLTCFIVSRFLGGVQWQNNLAYFNSMPFGKSVVYICAISQYNRESGFHTFTTKEQESVVDFISHA